VATAEREARLEELFAAGWTTELFAEFWAAPDLRYIPSIITDDVVGYWPGGRTLAARARLFRSEARVPSATGSGSHSSSSASAKRIG
jgi:hypothetical protein